MGQKALAAGASEVIERLTFDLESTASHEVAAFACQRMECRYRLAPLPHGPINSQPFRD
jgi:hypothetical protein